MSEFVQQQINDLQDRQARMEDGVKAATEATYDNKKTLKALHQRIDSVEGDLREVKEDMLTADQFEIMLETSFNRQFVKGMKYVIGACVTFVVAAWTDVINWITR